MSAEEVGLAALLRPFVIVALLWVVYQLVRIGARHLPPGELRDICNLTISNANQRAATKRPPRE